jgi:Bacteriophage Lambda NinG protein
MIASKNKKCNICKEKFTPRFSSFQKTCENPKCVLANRELEKKKEDKKWIADKKESLKTTSDWLQLLQTVFNTYIRLRDKDLPCISCDTTKTDIQYCAGHYFTRGAFPNLRVDEDNVHKQCNEHCNNKLSGNLLEYRPRLIARIGIDRFNALEERKQTELKLSLPEIKEKIAYYKDLIKQLKK